jgi:hypothetical protein
LLAIQRRGSVLGLGGAGASPIADLYMHCSVFVAPKGSTAAVGLVFMLIWSLFVMGPAGAVLLWSARYQSSSVDFWEHHGEATVKWSGTTYACNAR